VFRSCFFFLGLSKITTLERLAGIEPVYQAWEASVLPLNYSRNAYI
jgi:hypothetical protein